MGYTSARAPAKSASLYSENGPFRPRRCRHSHLWPVTLHKPRSSERFLPVPRRRPPRPGHRPAAPGYTRPRPPYTAAPARAFPASTPESRRIPPAPRRPATCPPRAVAPDTRPLWAPRSQAPPVPRWRPAAWRKGPGFRAENARRSARHNVRRAPPRRKPARVRPAEAHRRLSAAPARLRHSRCLAPPRSVVTPKGGSNPSAVPAGDRGPLSREFSQNSGVGVLAPKQKKTAPKDDLWWYF